MAAAWKFLQRSATLRAGETAALFRFWMARDTYQNVSPVQSVIFVNAVRYYLTTQGLAFSIFPCALPDFWAGWFLSSHPRPRRTGSRHPLPTRPVR